MTNTNEPEPKIGDIWYSYNHRSIGSEVARYKVTKVTKARMTLTNNRDSVDISRRTGNEVGASGYWMTEFEPETSERGQRFKADFQLQKARNRCIGNSESLLKTLRDAKLTVEQWERASMALESVVNSIPVESSKIDG